MKVYGKLGTWPLGLYFVRGRKRVLVKGRRVMLRSYSDPRCNKWVEAIVEEVNDNCTFFSLA